MSEVVGWVHGDNLTSLCEYLGHYTQVLWDDADQDALDGLIGRTDAEADDWFEYPIDGSPPLVICLAKDPGTQVVMVKVRGDFSDLLAARFETLIDLLSDGKQRAPG